MRYPGRNPAVPVAVAPGVVGVDTTCCCCCNPVMAPVFGPVGVENETWEVVPCWKGEDTAPGVKAPPTPTGVVAWWWWWKEGVPAPYTGEVPGEPKVMGSIGERRSRSQECCNAFVVFSRRAAQCRLLVACLLLKSTGQGNHKYGSPDLIAVFLTPFTYT